MLTNRAFVTSLVISCISLMASSCRTTSDSSESDSEMLAVSVLPASAGIKLTAADARAVYDKLNVPGVHDGGYHTFKKHSGKLVCTELTPWDAPSQYNCSMDSTLTVASRASRNIFKALPVAGVHGMG